MSGVGKTTLLDSLRRRGLHVVDTDYDCWVLPDGQWDEPRMHQLLLEHSDLVVSGTVENQVRFYDRFSQIVLLSAPLDVLLHESRTEPTAPTARRTLTARRSHAIGKQSSHYSVVGRLSSLMGVAQSVNSPTRFNAWCQLPDMPGRATSVFVRAGQMRASTVAAPGPVTSSALGARP
jgi:hypothetical protein